MAPYEADAQLAYLARTGVVDLVISEDSDTIPYGCQQVRWRNGVDWQFALHIDSVYNAVLLPLPGDVQDGQFREWRLCEVEARAVVGWRGVRRA